MSPTHDLKNHCFRLDIPEGRAVLDYLVEGNRVLITHTEVPPAMRGRGLAEVLTRAALAWVGEDPGRRVVPLCAYAAKFIARHPEFQRLLAETD